MYASENNATIVNTATETLCYWAKEQESRDNHSMSDAAVDFFYSGQMLTE